MAVKCWQTAAPMAASGCRPKTATPDLPSRPASRDVVKVSRLVKRADFLRLAKGRRYSTTGLVLQMQPAPVETGGLRIGFTATKKLGNAVVRNRVKRRLREVARLVMPLFAQTGCDYVLIGREATASRVFLALTEDLKLALSKVHTVKAPAGRSNKADEA